MLYRITKHANTRSIREPVNLLFDPQAEHQLRPDLQVTLAPTTECPNVRNFAVDLSLVCPFKGSASGNLSIGVNVPNDHEQITKKHINQRANVRRATKITRYEAKCQAKDTIFVPFIIYTSGMIHADGYKFLRQLAMHAANTRNASDPNPFFHYYLKVMNISLLKLVANTVFAKSIAHFSQNAYNAREHLRLGNKAVYDEWIPRPSGRLFHDRGD